MIMLALDFGGTKHSVGVWNPSSKTWRAILRQPSPQPSNREQDLAIILDLARQVLEGDSPECIGVSFGGPVDFSQKIVRLSHHVSGWENFPLGAYLQERYSAPVLIDNDANAAALGEYHFGAGMGVSSLFYITVSTGVGGGWILDGKPWRGSENMAGEIGHMVVDPSGPSCLCGKCGCIERFASGRYIEIDTRAEWVRNPGSGAIMKELINNDPSNIKGVIISRAAAMGDPLAQSMLNRAAWALGLGIGNVANLMNPARIILGGGVTKAGDLFWEIVRETARKTALPEIQTVILPAKLGDDAPLWGAIALFM